MVWAAASAAIIVVVIAAAVAFAYYAYRTAFYHVPDPNEDVYRLPRGEQYEERRDEMTTLIREMAEIPYEPVRIRSRDGVELFGRYYHVADGAPLQIQLHGYKGCGVRDFCGGNKLAREAGMNTLVVDERAHGRSGGRTITFGVREREDCAEWVKYAAARFPDAKIYLCGVSMGAAAVLMASPMEETERVSGIIADSAYSSPASIIEKVCGEMGFPRKLTMVFVRIGARVFGCFSIDESSAVECVKSARAPILLIHGEDDRFVPCDMSREIYDAARSAGVDVKLETFPGAGHGISFMADRERYKRVVDEFLSRC